MRPALTLVILVAMAATAPAAEPVATASAADEVKKLDASMNEAAVKRDVKVIERHTAAEFILTDPTGAVSDKKASVEAFRSGAYEFQSFKDSDVKAQVHGDVVVLTGRTDLKGKVQGQDISGPYRWMRVYVRRDGRWQCAAEQLTRITQP